MSKHNKTVCISRQLATAFQGLAFWMGYERALYKNYHFREHAVIHEACKLINTNIIHSGRIVIPERKYINLIPENANNDDLKGKRADLVICQKPSGGIDWTGNISKHVICVMEIKLAPDQGTTISEKVEKEENCNPKIIKDMERLKKMLSCMTCKSPPRAFFVYVSTYRPPIFVNSDGEAEKKPEKNCNFNGHYTVHRVLKAAHSFRNMDQQNGRNSANYVCMVEVFHK